MACAASASTDAAATRCSRDVAGAELCPLAEHDVCCGFGGLFAVKMPDISAAMLARKLGTIADAGADTVVVTDVSCAHAHGRRPATGAAAESRVRHIADVLARPRSGTA